MSVVGDSSSEAGIDDFNFDFEVVDAPNTSSGADFDIEVFAPKMPEMPFFLPNEHAVRAMVACMFCKHCGNKIAGCCDLSGRRMASSYIYCDHFDLHSRKMWIDKLRSHGIPGVGGWFDIKKDYLDGLPKSILRDEKKTPLQYHGPSHISCSKCGAEYSKRSCIR